MTDSRSESKYSLDSKNNKRKYLFDPDAKKYYKKGKKLGGGGFGEVFELIDSETGEIRAVKVISLKKLESPQSNEAYLNEYKFNNSLNYKYICKCYNTFKDNDNAYFILEYQPNKTLNELISNRYSLSEIEIKHYCYELLLAIEYLHNRNIIHRDIKLSNVLLSDKMEVKLCDFGLAIGNNAITSKTICGTPNYIAPEILNYKNGNYSFGIDIWSFGIILYSLFYKKTPFESQEKGKTKKNIQNVIYKFPENNQVSEDAKNLMRSIFVKEPSLRPSIKEIKESNFFNNGIGIPKYLPPSSQYMRLSIEYLQNFVNEAIANNECLDTENETTKINKNSPILKYKNSIDNYNESDSEPASNNSNSSELENDEESEKENNRNNKEEEKKSEKYKRKLKGRNQSVKLERIEQKYTMQNDKLYFKRLSNKNSRTIFHENEDENKIIGEKISNNKNDNNNNNNNILNNIHVNNIKNNDNDKEKEKDKEEMLQSKEEIYYRESGKFNNLHEFSKILNDTIESEINKINIKSYKDGNDNNKNYSKEENTETVLSDTLNISKNTLNSSNLFLSSKKVRFRNSSSDFLFKQFYHKSIVKKKMFNVLPQRTDVDNIVVKKFIDISSKCGIGYLLSNGDVGAYFNDGTKLVIIKDSFNIIYIDSKGKKRKIYLDDNYINDNDLLKKIKVLSLFFKKFNKNKMNEININQLFDKPDPDVYVTKWAKTSKASFFLLSNKEIQCIFNDKTQVIFNMKNKTVLFINHLKKVFKEDMRLDDFSSYEMTVRVLYAKKILIKL